MTKNEQEGSTWPPELLEMIDETKTVAISLLNLIGSQKGSDTSAGKIIGFVALKIAEKVYEDHIQCDLPPPADTWAGFAGTFKDIIATLASDIPVGEGAPDFLDGAGAPSFMDMTWKNEP